MTVGQDEREKMLLEAVDRAYTWGNSPRAHCTMLAVTSLGAGSVAFYFLYEQIGAASLPVWGLIIVWALACSFALLVGECVWRLSRYIDMAERDSAIYLVKQGVNPFSLTRLKYKDPPKKD